MKILLHLVIIAVLGFGWFKYSENKLTDEERNEVLMVMEDEGKSEEEIRKKEEEMKGDENEAIFTGILLTFLSAGYVGTLFVVYVLPSLAHRATQSVYDSAEAIGVDSMSTARSKMAQGDYDGAIEAFYEAANENPMNRVPYVEIAKIQLTQKEDPDSAIATLTHAIEGQAWEENDAAFLLFRLAELYHDEKNDVASANAVMQQVIDQFPATRHSANATHKMQEWSRGDA